MGTAGWYIFEIIVSAAILIVSAAILIVSSAILIVSATIFSIVILQRIKWEQLAGTFLE